MAEFTPHLPEPPAAGEVRAAGAVVWRPAGSGAEVALIHRQRYDDWTFPKGKALPGEHVLLTATREVAEETGVRVALGRRLSTTRYTDDGRAKRVDWWAASPAPAPPVADLTGPAAPAAAAAGAEFVPNDEVDGLQWLPPAVARERLSYPRDVQLLEEFTASPAATVPVILIRHGEALSKHSWSAAGETDDLARPLTHAGRVQSQQLAEILGCYDLMRVVSSAAERCLATMRSYAAVTGAAIDAEPAFTVGVPGADPDAAREQMLKLVTEGEPVAICGHRENLPVLLAAVCDRFGVPVPAGPPLPKGGLWVLQAAGGTLVSAEQHHLSG